MIGPPPGPPPSPIALSNRAALMLPLLANQRRRRVDLTELWRTLDSADPASGTHSRRRSLLAGALTELADHRHTVLPAGASWDRTALPPLPRFVTLPAPKRQPSPIRRTIWHPGLAWAANITWTPSQREYLDRINHWLHTNPNPATVPMRERSLDIFRHEKTIDGLLSSAIFGPDRVTLGLLHAYRSRVRFTVDQISDAPTILIIENSDTFDSIATAIRHHNATTVGAVGWGAGKAFEASVLSLARLPSPVHNVYYFGDIDENGLRIPANANATSAREELPTIKPASYLYKTLLERGVPDSGQRKLSDAAATELVAWLPPDLGGQAAAHLTGGTRLAQEAVGLAYLTTTDEWLTELT